MESRDSQLFSRFLTEQSPYSTSPAIASNSSAMPNVATKEPSNWAEYNAAFPPLGMPQGKMACSGMPTEHAPQHAPQALQQDSLPALQLAPQPSPQAMDTSESSQSISMQGMPISIICSGNRLEIQQRSGKKEFNFL